MRQKITAVLRDGGRRRQLLIAVAAALVVGSAILAALLVRGRGEQDSPCPRRAVLYWYDPMIPQERYPGPGKSSMNMDLIPKCAGETAEGVRVSPAMQQNLGIRTARAEVRDIAPMVRAVGRVELDERLIAEVQTLTPGFVDQLTVRAEGEPVQRGARIATVYSPELLTAQNEFKAVLAMPAGVAPASLRQAARNRLRLLGLPNAAIQRLERGGAPQRTYPVFAPTSGIITAIGARPGAQVSPGQSIVTIGGLSRVWVVAEVPEASLGDVRVGLPAEVSFAAYPGDVRAGTIDYIFPRLEPEARTARVRLTLDNPGQRLLAGMFANITIRGTGGMALVVPSEAVIDTGRRRVVIARRNGAFLPVEVEMGRQLDEWTQILSGVQRGDEVVVSGQFLIDSEASLSGVMDRLAAASRQPAGEPAARATGTIRSMDLQRGRMTIAHGPVPALNWPPMTMTFVVRNPVMLRGLTRGDRIEFAFRRQGDSFVVERIRKAAAR